MESNHLNVYQSTEESSLESRKGDSNQVVQHFDAWMKGLVLSKLCRGATLVGM